MTDLSGLHPDTKAYIKDLLKQIHYSNRIIEEFYFEYRTRWKSLGYSTQKDRIMTVSKAYEYIILNKLRIRYITNEVNSVLLCCFVEVEKAKSLREIVPPVW